MLDIWDEKLVDYGIKIYEYRKEFINKLIPKMENLHKEITNNKEKIKIEYITECENKEKYIKLLKESGAKIVTLGDRILRTETVALNVLSIIMYEFEQ